MKIRRAIIVVLTLAVVVPILAAWIEWLVSGLPSVPPFRNRGDAVESHGFPAWVCVTHYVNFLFIVLLIRSGIQILMDHPRLYWNVHCTPGTEWIRFTPVEVPRNRIYTAKEDARHVSPIVGIPGGRHKIGLARHFHFVAVVIWLTSGATYVALLFATSRWHRLVPASWSIVPAAWNELVYYATLHMPPQPDGFFAYGPLQQLAYFGVVFVLAPLSIVTGPAMSPALVNRYSWYRRLPGNRQIARSLHFIALCGYIAFLIPHVTLVVLTGFRRNMNHIVLGSDGTGKAGIIIGAVGAVVLVAVNVLANWTSWRRPRWVQRMGDIVVNPLLRVLLGRAATKAEYRKEDISPFFWPNGKRPTSDEWKNLAARGFGDYRLKVFGLVERPVELSLKEIEALGRQTQITLQHCIQGWSGIAEWGGLPFQALVDHVRVSPKARVAIFYSFGEGIEGGEYYDSHTMENLLHPQTLLAYEMNFEPLPLEHGAPLRLRVENQLGFKMVKWIRAIEFAEDYRHVHGGFGGYAEDNEFFDSMADI